MHAYTGYFYKLTDKGKMEAEEIIETLLNPHMRYSDILVNALEHASMH